MWVGIPLGKYFNVSWSFGDWLNDVSLDGVRGVAHVKMKYRKYEHPAVGIITQKRNSFLGNYCVWKIDIREWWAQD